MKEFRKRFITKRKDKYGNYEFFKQCPVCLKEFKLVNRYTRRKYCSDECKRKNLTNTTVKVTKLVQRTKEKDKIYTCVHCGKKFSDLKQRDSICSDECFSDFISKLENKNEKVSIAFKEFNKTPESITHMKLINEDRLFDYDVEIPDDSKYNFVEDFMEDYFKIENW